MWKILKMNDKMKQTGAIQFLVPGVKRFSVDCPGAVNGRSRHRVAITGSDNYKHAQMYCTAESNPPVNNTDVPRLQMPMPYLHTLCTTPPTGS